MRILVTGTSGYIGTLLGPHLMGRGHDVVGLDTGFYREGWLYNGNGGSNQAGSNQGGNLDRFPTTINKDIRHITEADLEGFDAVAHLAELSNDPLGQINPQITYKINHEGSVKLAELCKQVGIERFVYTSSCSVYGVGADDWKTEESDPNPQTAYAECKVLVERDVSQLADDNFSPTFLRNATAYGPSPRMRFDIVLNNLAGLAWTLGEIRMISDGTPWRPLVHLLDICQAVACSLEAPRAAVHDQIFNVGHSDENYRVREIAEIVAQTFPSCEMSLGDSGGDNRSYRVRFDKIAEQLPGFTPRFSARDGAEQLCQIFSAIQMSDELFNARPYTRLKQLQHLIGTQQLNSDLFWVTL